MASSSSSSDADPPVVPPPAEPPNADAETVTVVRASERSEHVASAIAAQRSVHLRIDTTSAKPPTSRYEIKKELGKGGAGCVLAARDVETRRLVALKVPRHSSSEDGPTPSGTLAHFLGEASITAQLEHPTIIPIYDVGRGDDGAPYYTMRLVESRSLFDVLGNPALRKEYPTCRFVSILIQVSRALAYAHSRGVVHRDIKPANILLGAYGEVYLADWGIALIAEDSPISLDAVHDGPEHHVDPTTRLVGTPGYMAPELISGPSEKVDPRSDLFGLGVVLYELLAGKPPFRRDSVPATLTATYADEPVRPSTFVKGCPLLLEDLCLTLLAKDPDARPSSAEEVARRLEEYLEGAKDKTRRAEEARALCTRAEAPVARYHALQQESTGLREEAARLLRSINSWEPVEVKRPAWTLEAHAQKAECESGLVLAEAIDCFTKAIGHDPTCTEAHRGLADLYWTRARAAEKERRPAAIAYYEALVREHDDGRYGAILGAHAFLSIGSRPDGARVTVQRYVERDRVLTTDSPRALGKTPIRHAKLEPGSWLVTLDHDDYRHVRYPVLLRRGAHHDAHDVDLFTDEEIGEGFVYVPAGPTILGGDPDAYDSLPRQEIEVPSFAIAIFPITMREYCAFLDHLQQSDPELAMKRAPHDVHGSSEGMIVHRNVSSGLWEPSPLIMDGEARRHFPIEEGHLWQTPVHLIDWFDAKAYCEWRGGGSRLPLEIEWGKAARGVDGRFYPWGDPFDPTFCKMRDSRSYVQRIEPIGTHETDCSPYGVRDMAGNVRNWMADIVDRQLSVKDLATEPEPKQGTDRGDSSFRCARGGIWNGNAQWARCESRSPRLNALSRGGGLGIRLAKDLPQRDRSD